MADVICLVDFTEVILFRIYFNPRITSYNVCYTKLLREFEMRYVEFLNANNKDIMDRLAKGELSDEITSVLAKVAAEFTEKYKK